MMETSSNLVVAFVTMTMLFGAFATDPATCDTFTCAGDSPVNNGAGVDCEGECNPEKCCQTLRWIAQPSPNATCSPGVCTKGKWSAYYGGKTASECRAKCDEFRRLIPEPEGLIENVYRFRQDGSFHNVKGDPPGTLLRAPDFERNVTQINYRGTGHNWPGWNRRDQFYARWEGKIQINQAGIYKFTTSSDDGSRLYINGNRIVDNPGWHGMRMREGTAELSSGLHDFWAEMFEGGGGAGMELYYQGMDSGNNRVIIPASAFPQQILEKALYKGQNGQFHNWADMLAPRAAKTPAMTRAVKQINYRGTGGFFDSEFQKLNLRDHFYMRWDGYIEIKVAGTYKFWTKSDDGSRLYIDGASFVQNPGWHGMRDRQGQHELTAGKHVFWAEMFEGGGGAGMEMSYQGPDTNNARVIVPESVLSGTETGSNKLMLPPSPLGGLCSAYSHKGTNCVIYSACESVSATTDQVCEDSSLNWVGMLGDFQTCQYPDHEHHIF